MTSVLHEPNVAETLTRWAAFTEISSANRRPIQGWLHLFPRRRPQLTARRRVGKRCRVWNASLIPPVPSCRRDGILAFAGERGSASTPSDRASGQTQQQQQQQGTNLDACTQAAWYHPSDVATPKVWRSTVRCTPDMVRLTNNFQFHPRLAPTHVKYRPSHPLQNSGPS